MHLLKSRVPKLWLTARRNRQEIITAGLSRRELFKRGSLLGMSLPFLGLLAGGAETAFAAPTRAAARRAGGTLRVGGVIADGSLEPPLLHPSCHSEP